MKEVEEILADFYLYLKSKGEHMVGYPCNLNYNFESLYKFFELSINNIGDPLSNGPYKLKAHDFEKKVVEFFAEVVGVDGDNFWGYVTNGGTEGNMYGLYVAREIYPDSIVYYSEEAHYSIPKILKLLRMPSISVKALDNGEMDTDDLSNALKFNRTKTPIILATIGTTMKSGFDNLPKIKNIIKDLAFNNHYIHCDAALGGMLLPFCEEAFKIGLSDGVHSISVSGHKMFGSPMPCGIVLARKDYVDKLASSVEYIGALDTTLSGSRNGHTTLLLWYAIQKNGMSGYKEIAKSCIETAEYAVTKLKENGVDAWRNRFSNTVVLPRPSLKTIDKWQLAPQRDLVHLITMPHVTKSEVDLFVSDYIND